jgi:dolichol-phosphate mannosyltransferase
MLSIIIPTYNERENILLLVSRLEKAVHREHEIIIVDDNSPDGTATEVERLRGKYPSLRLVKRESKGGLTGAVVAGAKAARGDALLVMDADLSHPPENVPELVSSLEGADLVIGSRLMKGGGVEKWPFHRRMVSAGAGILARMLLGIRCSDPMSGFFAVRKDIFTRTRFRAKGYKLLLNILADNRKLKAKEVPYMFMDRRAGRTKLGAGEMLTYVLDLFRIRFG